MAQTITGRVFRDFNSDGTYQTSATAGTYNETGARGMVVTAYNAANTMVSSATTTAAGTYTLTTGTGAFRIEFTKQQADDFDSFRGAGSGTSVQFASGGATNLNLGINYPANYCGTTNPAMFVACYINGDPLSNTGTAGASANRDVLVSLPYNSSGQTATETMVASGKQMGSVYGMAVLRATNKLFVGAFTKRHVGFGPGGPGAIYVTDMATNTTKLFATLNAGADPHTGLTSTPSDPNVDAAAFDQVGKMGLGDIEISDDGQFLYVMNLFDRRIYIIPVNTPTNPTPGAITSVPVPVPGCTNGTNRPFALKYYRSQLFVGQVCSNESLPVVQSPFTVPNAANAFVHAFDATPATGALSATAQQVLTFPLTYAKGATNDGAAVLKKWYAWGSDFYDAPYGLRNRGGNNPSYPQPWLTDLEIDVDGTLILGIRDRYGDQGGNQNRGTDPADNNAYQVIANGDILRAGRCGAGITFTLESAGSVCGSTPTSSGGNGEGVGGGEFYADNVFCCHNESSMGGLALFPGMGEVVNTSLDPVELFSGGFRFFDNVTGEQRRPSGQGTGVQVYASADAITFGKANGLGDVELDCDAAPIQIGNRVWRDTNDNGIQDPDELPLSGIAVVLKGPGLPAAGASVTTNASGEYYFSNATGTNATGFVFGLTNLTHSTSYTLSFPTSASAGAFSLSTKPSQTTGVNGDIIDSDPTADGSLVFILGSFGHNNFSYDAGYVPCSLTATLTSSSNTLCTGQTATLTATGGSSYTLLNTATVNTTGTFAGLAPTATTTYTVVVSNGNACTATATSTLTVNPQPTVTVSSVVCNGLTTFTVNFTAIPGATIQADLGTVVGNQVQNVPTGQVVTLLATLNSCTANTTATADCQANAASLGDYVFVDQDHDGIQTTGDTPLEGVLVTLISNGTVVSTQTTNATGNYLFTGLTPGIPYSVSFTTPTGYSATLANQGGNGALNSDPVGGISTPISLSAGEQNLDLDAGFVKLLPVLELTKTVNRSRAALGQVVSYTITLTNSGLGLATGVVVSDTFTAGVSPVAGSVATSTGTFTQSSNGLGWTLDQLPAGATATLTYSASLVSEGISYNTASLAPGPGNPDGVVARVCTSVPFRVCANETFGFRLTAPGSLSAYQWSRNGQPIGGATSQTYVATEAGEYAVSANNESGCASGACCPFIIETIPAPGLSVLAVAPSCQGPTPRQDALISLISSTTSALTYNISPAGSFTGAVALFNQPKALASVTNGILLNSEPGAPLPEGQVYTIRVYSAEGCFSDVVTTIPASACSCPPVVCAPISVRKTQIGTTPPGR